jgi:hypothetical protein
MLNSESMGSRNSPRTLLKKLSLGGVLGLRRSRCLSLAIVPISTETRLALLARKVARSGRLTWHGCLRREAVYTDAG